MIYPVALVNFEVYENGDRYLGIAKATLPDISLKTVTISGAGLGGDLDVPITGMTDNMEFSLDMLDPNGDVVKMFTPVKHLLTLMPNMENWDVSEAEVGYWADRYSLIAKPKTFKPGDLNPWNKANTHIDFDVYFYAGYRDGAELWYVDKRTMICRINGVDYMEKIRKNMGLQA